MDKWGKRSNECLIGLYQIQQGIFKEILMSATAASPEYLEIKDIYESHLSRQSTFAKRVPNIIGYSKYTANKIIEGIGDEKILKLAEEGTFPREPASGMSYFVDELTKTLQTHEMLSAYLSSLRNTIGCCDDYIDKDRYYLVYGENLFFLSHFMLDMGEVALLKTGLLSEEKCNEISRLNIEMIAQMKEGDEKSDIFKKSYPQGFAFAKIVGLFSTLDDVFKEKIAEAAGYYDFGSHILGEILDSLNGEKNCLSRDIKGSFEEAINAYSKAVELCPECGLRECTQLEKANIEELFLKPDELEKMAQRRKKKKQEYPTTRIMELKQKETAQ